jgi:hypothetical protein
MPSPRLAICRNGIGPIRWRCGDVAPTWGAIGRASLRHLADIASSAHGRGVESPAWKPLPWRLPRFRCLCGLGDPGFGGCADAHRRAIRDSREGCRLLRPTEGPDISRSAFLRAWPALRVTLGAWCAQMRSSLVLGRPRNSAVGRGSSLPGPLPACTSERFGTSGRKRTASISRGPASQRLLTHLDRGHRVGRPSLLCLGGWQSREPPPSGSRFVHASLGTSPGRTEEEPVLGCVLRPDSLSGPWAARLGLGVPGNATARTRWPPFLGRRRQGAPAARSNRVGPLPLYGYLRSRLVSRLRALWRRVAPSRWVDREVAAAPSVRGSSRERPPTAPPRGADRRPCRVNGPSGLRSAGSQGWSRLAGWGRSRSGWVATRRSSAK